MYLHNYALSQEACATSWSHRVNRMHKHMADNSGFWFTADQNDAMNFNWGFEVRVKQLAFSILRSRCARLPWDKNWAVLNKTNFMHIIQLNSWETVSFELRRVLFEWCRQIHSLKALKHYIALKCKEKNWNCSTYKTYSLPIWHMTSRTQLLCNKSAEVQAVCVFSHFSAAITRIYCFILSPTKRKAHRYGKAIWRTNFCRYWVYCYFICRSCDRRWDNGIARTIGLKEGVNFTGFFKPPQRVRN